MNAQELITSGKLELYVAGGLSEREMRAVAAYAQEHPLVAYEIERIEETVVKWLGEATAPEEALEAGEMERLMARIRDGAATPGVASGAAAFPGAMGHRASGAEGVGQGATARPPADQGSVTRPPVRRTGIRWLAAAAVGGLIITTTAAIRLGMENHSLRSQMAGQDQQFAIMRNILTKRVELTNVSGNKITGKDNYLLVYWNPGSQKWVLANANLPALSKDQQYQLWALYEGKPIDAGVFDADNSHFNVAFQKDVPNAQAFAVTVEPRGGSKSPTLSNLCMMAKL